MISESSSRRCRYYWLLLAAVLLVYALVDILWCASEPGEINDWDFRYGFQVYIREGYTEIQNDSTFGYPAAAGGQEPVIWQVTDQDMKNGIYRLCREIERVREYIPYIDRMPETSEDGATVHQPTLYIVAGNYGYVIEPVYWGDMGTEQLQDERRPRGALVRLHRYSLWPKAFSSQDGRIEYLLYGDAKETPRASDESSGWISAFPG